MPSWRHAPSQLLHCGTNRQGRRLRLDSRSAADERITMDTHRTQGSGSMTHKFPLVDGLLHLASTSHARSVVTVAAVSFAVCHFVVLATAPTSVVFAGDLD